MRETFCCERGWKRLGLTSVIVPLLAAAFLPKCPLCFAAWLGIGAAGLWLQPVWGWPLTAILVGASLGTIAYGLLRRPRP